MRSFNIKNLHFAGVLLLSMTFLNSNAQEYLPLDATWYYRNYEPIQTSFQKIVVTSDTTINGESCKKLTQFDRFGDPVKYYYLKQEGTRIVYLSENTGEFYTLYDFSLVKGQSFTLIGFPDSGTVSIDSSSVVVINGQELRYQEYRYESISHTFNGSVIEGIGSLGFLFPLNDGVTVHALRCYEDKNLGKFEYVDNGDCELIAGIDNLDKPSLISWGNPFNEQLVLPKIFDEVIIFDVTGKVVLKGEKLKTLNTTHLKSGLYVLSLKSGNALNSFKIVKN